MQHNYDALERYRIMTFILFYVKMPSPSGSTACVCRRQAGIRPWATFQKWSVQSLSPRCWSCSPSKLPIYMSQKLSFRLIWSKLQNQHPWLSNEPFFICLQCTNPTYSLYKIIINSIYIVDVQKHPRDSHSSHRIFRK